MVKVCASCQTAVTSPDQRFCDNCGAPLSLESPAPQPTPPPEATPSTAPPAPPRPRQKSLLLEGAAPPSIVGEDFLQQIRALSFKEILLIDGKIFLRTIKTPIFWFVGLIAFLPMLVGWMGEKQFITSEWIFLGLYQLLIASIWGLLFFRLFAEEGQSIFLGAFCLLFTAIPGLWLLLQYLSIPPSPFDAMIQSGNPIGKLIGYTFGVGIREEITKALPLFLLMYAHYEATKGDGKVFGLSIPSGMLRAFSQPMDGIIFGMMSGLGFSATENVQYMLKAASAPGIMAALNAFIRASGLMFSHALWSGLFGYFLGLSAVRPEQRKALLVIGLMVASLVHGLYDAFVGWSLLLGIGIQLFGYVLLLSYIAKQKQIECASEIKMELIEK